jgi:hypothetical protein
MDKLYERVMGEGGRGRIDVMKKNRWTIRMALAYTASVLAIGGFAVLGASAIHAGCISLWSTIPLLFAVICVAWYRALSARSSKQIDDGGDCSSTREQTKKNR